MALRKVIIISTENEIRTLNFSNEKHIVNFINIFDSLRGICTGLEIKLPCILILCYLKCNSSVYSCFDMLMFLLEETGCDCFVNQYSHHTLRKYINKI